ncbi:MAG: endonuclease/exonuclease/phosphatase family protein, partial [Phycisphaerae bacterium]
AKVRGESFRFVSTHLESVSDLIRQAQAAELVAGLADSPLPTVLVGDFNATPTGPDSGAYNIITAAGFADAWTVTHPGEDGFTWGQAELLDNPVSTADQRIDHLFTRGALFAADVTLVGDDPADRTPSGLWPSDHAGVVGDLVLARRPAQTGFAFSTAAIGKTKLRPEAVWA